MLVPLGQVQCMLSERLLIQFEAAHVDLIWVEYSNFLNPKHLENTITPVLAWKLFEFDENWVKHIKSYFPKPQINFPKPQTNKTANNH